MQRSKTDSLRTSASEWDRYWDCSQRQRWLYNLIASLYRFLFIEPSLRRFCRKYFQAGALLCHAGCGGGEVDRRLSKEFKIIALDFSMAALNVYATNIRQARIIVRADINCLPLNGDVLDGIYNCGVMEHFSESEIKAILAEWRLCLRPGGKVVLLWPPEGGTSVIFFKLLTRAWALVTRKPLHRISFHPVEICRLRSHAHAERVFEGTGFSIVEYVLDWRDLRTCVVVVAEKN